MSRFYAFLQKEFMEQLRTHKATIMLAIFAFFGMLSPLLAKLMPVIMSSVGVEIQLPPPTHFDAYSQFFKNVTQMGMIVLVLVFSGTVSGELSRGTLINILSKGVSRSTVILAKYTAALVLWTVSLVLGAILNYIYTRYLFGSSPVANLLFSLFSLWLFVALALAILLAASTLVNSNYGGLLLTMGALVVMLLLHSFPLLRMYIPTALAAENVRLLLGQTGVNDLLPAVAIAVAAIGGCLAASLTAFSRKQL